MSALKMQAYSEGWTAADVLAELKDSDFVQSGGLVTSDAVTAAGGRASEINRELFIMYVPCHRASCHMLSLLCTGVLCILGKDAEQRALHARPCIIEGHELLKNKRAPERIPQADFLPCPLASMVQRGGCGGRGAIMSTWAGILQCKRMVLW